jgi:acyl-CoA synthetase (NDP forming)
MSAPDLFRALFEPESIALVGASGDLRKNTARPQRFLQRHGVKGRIIPVNPNRDEVFGLRAFPSLKDVPGGVDHAFVMVPAAAVADVVKACGEAKVPVATIYSDGFADSGAKGIARQRKLVDLARANNIRLLGPNSMGLVNVATGMALTVNAVLEYRPNKRPFPQVRRVSPGYPTVVNLRFDAVLAGIPPRSRQAASFRR